MAMMISKFNKLIKSRLIWIIFLVVIVFAFVFWGMRAPEGHDGQRRIVGSMHGRDVDLSDYSLAHEKAFIGHFWETGRFPGTSEQEREYLEQQTWKRIATLTKAHDAGLRVPDAMLAQVISHHPFFQDNGRFDPDLYAQVIEFMQRERRIGERSFQEILRENIEMQFLRRKVSNLAPVTPREIEEAARMLTDKFTIAYAQLSADDVADRVSFTEEDIEKYYEANAQRYTTPQKYKLHYAAFPYHEFHDKVPEISDEDIESYYRRNRDDFLRIPDGETEENEDEVSPLPLEEVRDEIVTRLRDQRARRMALRVANDFAGDLAPDYTGEHRSLRELSEEMGVEWGVIPPFAEGETPDFHDAAREIAVATRQLDFTPIYNYSDPLTGDHGVYVVALAELIDPELQPLEEVREEVIADVQRESERAELRKLAAEIHEHVSTALAENYDFAEILEEKGYGILEAGPFSVSRDFLSEPLLQDFMPGLALHEAGELMDIVDAGSRMLIAYVSRREQEQDTGLLQLVKEHVETALLHNRVLIAYDAYQQFLLDEAQFKERDWRNRSAAE